MLPIAGRASVADHGCLVEVLGGVRENHFSAWAWGRVLYSRSKRIGFVDHEAAYRRREILNGLS